MNDAETIAQMRRHAQRLQDDGALNAAQSMRDGADRLEMLTQNAQAPNVDQEEAKAVLLGDGSTVSVREYGAEPRRPVLGSGTPFTGPDYL